MGTLTDDQKIRLEQIKQVVKGTLYFVLHKQALDVEVFLLFRRSGPKNVCVYRSISLKQFEKKLKSIAGISKKDIDNIDIRSTQEIDITHSRSNRHRFKTSEENYVNQLWWNKD